MLVGRPSVFAIESSMSAPRRELSLRGLGYFVLHIAGVRYGVYSPEATMLACSLDSVRSRIARRGAHSIPLLASANAASIADSFYAARYDEDRQDEKFFGMSADEFSSLMVSRHVIWAPDGDEAFDDGSFVLQLDQDDKARLIAFRTSGPNAAPVQEISEVRIDSDEFYAILDTWQKQFEKEWSERVARM